METQKTQKDLSNWLIASDVDGTLNTKMRTLPKRNLDAIAHFVCDLNGNFTLASGRNVASIRKHYEKLPIKTPAVVMNGAGIYDFSKEEMIWYCPINEEGEKLTAELHKKFPMAEIAIFCSDIIYLVNGHIFAPAVVAADSLPHKRCKSIDEVPSGDWGKVIFFGLPFVISKIKKFCPQGDSSPVNFVSSSVVSFEMLNKGVHKGTAIKKLAKILGVSQECTGAIGDYYNDLDMLKSVALPAACGQAPSDIKDIAKVCTCHCNKGAVADLLEYLEHNYL